MKTIIELLVAGACAYGLFIQLLRIIWLQFPEFLKHTGLYNAKQPKKLEMFLYFLVAIIAMSYYIVVTIEKIL
jgi:hypothetical protein